MTETVPCALVCIPSPFLEAAPEFPQRLAALGVDVRVEAPTFVVPYERFLALARDADIAVVSLERVDERVLEAAPRLRLIVKHGAGVDNIDLAAATRRGVAVANLPGLNASAVADLTLGLALALARRIVEAAALVRGGGWGYVLGSELAGKTYGVIGTGRIGREVIRRAAGFGMALLGYDVAAAPELEAQGLLRYVPLDALLRAADVVSVHVPLSDETRGLIGARELGMMKPGALLVNVSRGGIVDEEALYDALQTGRPAGAALDVFVQEPPVRSPLLALPTVLPTPHIGGSTVETAHRLAAACTDVVRKFLAGEVPPLLNPEVWRARPTSASSDGRLNEADPERSGERREGVS